ncbi:hypothetical protein IT413_02855 [Candidatus Peregrinibacteria bacterium]|nr:hypothetical protein [Candidatus Peregrinibacteria bacterium]
MKKIKKTSIKSLVKKVRSERAGNLKKAREYHFDSVPFRLSDAILVFGGATICALIVVTALLEIVLYGSWRLPKVADLKGAAPVVEQVSDLVKEKQNENNFLETYTSNVDVENIESTQESDKQNAVVTGGDVFVETKEFKSFGARGQKDVLLFDAIISSLQDASLREITFRTEGYARPYDVASMQLYVNGKFVSEAPVFEGKAQFLSLKLEVQPGEQLFLKVHGTMGNEAVAGDRLQIGFLDSSDMKFVSDDGKRLTVGGKFPIWGGFVSVIGDKL